jgi:SpoVK/Ycf46/Vps4 family AAA+-type ATPase
MFPKKISFTHILYALLMLITTLKPQIEKLIKYIMEMMNSKSKKITDKVVTDDYYKENETLHPINMDINNLGDLIKLGESYDSKETKKYVINLKILNGCVPELKELNNVIGMNSIKQRILDFFFFYFQNFTKKDQGKEMMHTIIEGPPGSGKTEVAKILGKLYYKMGLVKQNKFTEASRCDFIGEFVGHTERNCKKIFEKARGGILFIDEAYSLGYSSGGLSTGSYAQVVIDILTKKLTEQKGETIVMLAGYKDELAKSLFSHNKGLARRFPYKFTIEKYSAMDLKRIYEKMVKDNGWLVGRISEKFFKTNYKLFPYFGGDMENLWSQTKIVHSRRVFGKDIKLRKYIVQRDVDNAFTLFMKNGKVEKVEKKDDLVENMKKVFSKMKFDDTKTNETNENKVNNA